MPGLDFQHIIITRFNLKKRDWKQDKNHMEVLGETWEKDRIRLFKKFCLPSIIGQSVKKFQWIIFFQSNPSREIKKLVEDLMQIPIIEPVFVNSFEDFQVNLSAIIKKRIKSETKYMLTTRLDNDDALSYRFIENVQNAVINLKKDTLLYFPQGLFLEYGNNCRLAAFKYPYNQFLSLYEKVPSNSKVKTVLSRAHDDWKDHQVMELKEEDAWLQVVHDKNMLNTFQGVPVYSSRLKKFRTKKVNFKPGYNLRLFKEGIRRRKERLIANFRPKKKSLKEEKFDNPSKWIEKILIKPNACIIQIGSNDGKSGDPLYDLILKNLRWKILFVEPVLYLFKQLKENYGNENRFNFENVAINNGSWQTFYFISENAKKERPDLPTWIEQLGSFKKSNITDHLNGVLAPYIKEKKVLGITLTELLERNRVNSIDLLHIDVEGYDWAVLSQLELDKFSPEIILYEHKHLNHTDKTASVTFLKKHNFMIYQLGSDYIAIRNNVKNLKKIRALKGKRI